MLGPPGEPAGRHGPTQEKEGGPLAARNVQTPPPRRPPRINPPTAVPPTVIPNPSFYSPPLATAAALILNPSFFFLSLATATALSSRPLLGAPPKLDRSIPRWCLRPRLR
jgi:hypothetical protein